jgi:hypothetical protein
MDEIRQNKNASLLEVFVKLLERKGHDVSRHKVIVESHVVKNHLKYYY